MSLDLDTKNKINVGSAGTYAVGLTATPTAAQISGGAGFTDLQRVKAFIDTTAGDVTIVNATIDAYADLEPGDVLQIVKTVDANKILFTSPDDGVAYDFVNKAQEFYTLTFDGTQFII